MSEKQKLRVELQEAQTRIGVLCAERDAYLQQRDEAIGERNELLRQRDEAVRRSARLVHRADLKSSRKPRVATRDRILLFLHLVGSGGEKLTDILLRNFAPGDFLPIDTSEVDESAVGTWSHQAAVNALGRMRQSEIDALRVVWGRFRHNVQAHFPKPCDCVTLLHDPLELVISNQCNDDGAVAKAGELVGNCLDRHQRCPPHLDNQMTRALSGVDALDPPQRNVTVDNARAVTDADFEIAAKNLDGYLVVGLTDQFDQTLLVLGAELGWSLTDLVYSPLNAPLSRPAAADIPEHVRRKVLDWNRYDTALIGRGRRHLADRIASYPGDFQNNLALFRWINMLFRKGASFEELHRMEFNALRS